MVNYRTVGVGIFFSTCLEMPSRINCSITFPWNRGVCGDPLVVSNLLFLAVFEDWNDMGFTPVLRHLLPSSMTFQSSLAIASASFHSTCACLPSEPIDLCEDASCEGESLPVVFSTLKNSWFFKRNLLWISKIYGQLVILPCLFPFFFPK